MAPQNFCSHSCTNFRVVPAPMLSLPPNHVLLNCICPCGTYRTYFTIHRNVILNQMARSQLITQNMRSQLYLQRLEEMQFQARILRYGNRKERETMQMNNDQEEDIDR
ncbi:hypothetical protein WN48_08550 [Eufriesea mexicana]|uniref:Uncharacterized protein n=1 Tax=Eufriesea mexicana TaxID=516756 RepID=A0A310SJY2_9HYME|nr:PREDICTED: uncharacterized protein LOC108552126 [Eufriesea mexicana]OAD53945.1 hypothetical protein WN48_08550 [Eufriesea mexicana]